ncbi:hypothetical protein QBC34DRAFT_51237 [Podospora aff. communis PSN243]|uniref:Uncharacterized protein n=1 Tax=Podospora aff. communis PSN243 TaxID=3040156 RepID=A0AAV9GTR8_9PEZI|nr:hypothetical protein QBC34DRAFT_51237 [Podospora aff. communis PSN243]
MASNTDSTMAANKGDIISLKTQSSVQYLKTPSKATAPRMSEGFRLQNLRQQNFTHTHISQISFRRPHAHKRRLQRRRKSLLSIYYNLIRKPCSYQIEKCRSHPSAGRSKTIDWLHQTDQLFRLRIIAATTAKTNEMAPKASPQSSGREDASDDDATQTASVSSADSRPMSEASIVPSNSTAPTTPDLSESEEKEPEAGPPAKRTKIAVKKATETTPGRNASAIVSKANVKAKLASPPKPADQFTMTGAKPSPVSAKLASPLKPADKFVMSGTKPSPVSAKAAAPVMTAATTAATTTTSPQGTKRKRDALAALPEKPSTFHETWVQETLANPLEVNDWVFEAPASAHPKMERNRRLHLGFRRASGQPPLLFFSGALPVPKGSAATEDDAEGEESNDAEDEESEQPKVTPAVTGAPQGALILGWVPGEARWKRRSYFGLGRSRMSWN